MIETSGDAPSLCLWGNHRHDGGGRLCDRHLPELVDLIGDVARQTSALGDCLIPGTGAAGPGQKVSTSRVGSPTPVRLDVLSLIGPGGAEVRLDARNLAPLVRRWSTVSTYKVQTLRRVEQRWEPVTEERTLRTYHVEVVAGADGRAVRRMDDDQVGAVPPAEWADTWVRRWRLVLLEHYRWMRRRDPGKWIDYEPPAQVDNDQDKRLTRAGLGEWMRYSHGRPAVLQQVGSWLALRVAYQAARDALPAARLGVRRDGPDGQTRAAAAETGNTRAWPDIAAGTLACAEDALAGARPPAIAHDPDTAEWVLRYGTARTVAAVEVDCHYLATWLPTLAELDDPDDNAQLGGFVAELLALHKELAHVLGETKDETWLGRCPVHLVDGDGNETGRLCGAGLWHDPAKVGWRIECPRCHSTWPETEWLTLAARIRHAWPIDTRRRYTATDRQHADRSAQLPACKGCERRMVVDWRPSPARGDRERMWRPLKLLCPQGCLSAGMVAA